MGARDRAFVLLTARAASFPDISLEAVQEAGLSARDAALAHTIVDSATRSWLTLVHLLNGFLKTPFDKLEPGLRAVLLGGAAQIAVMDRVPVHAAIDTSVEWAKRALRPGAGALVNAVLRRVAALCSASSSGERPRRPRWSLERDEIPLPDGSALILSGPVLPEDPRERLAVATSNPPWLVSRWWSQFGPERARAIACHGLIRAPVILNTAHAGAPLSGTRLKQHSLPGHAVATGPRAWLSETLPARRDIWVQDPASARAVREIAGFSPGSILDLCAGQGTKTRQLEAVFPRARIIASDPDPLRASVLRGVFAGSERVTVVEPSQARTGKADLILLDVPCSNTGVLARRVEARYRCGPVQLARLTALQRQILAEAAPLLSAGGRIVYSTCSLDEEENQSMARWAGELGLQIERESSTMPAGEPGGDVTEYHDGAYSAVLWCPGRQ